MTAATAWLTDPIPGRGVHLADDDGLWSYVSYPELAADARKVGAQLAAAGVQPGDIVSILMPTGFPYLAAFFGIWVAGATPCPVVPPAFQAHDEYATHVATILSQARPKLVVTSDDYVALVTRAMQQAGRTDSPWIPAPGGEEIDLRPRGELALLQFTSGSTGNPRGARASWGNLEANLEMIHRMVRYRDGEAAASWLPLHHDMGLIGCLLGTVTVQGDLWLMQPEQFIRRPLQWLECFAPGKAVHTASPAFGFAYMARRLTPEKIAGLDLSGWRTAMVGAETVDPAALADFAQLARPVGFRSEVYLPAYGLAEATLAVAIAAEPAQGALVQVDTAALRFGEPVKVTATARLGEESRAAHDGWLVGHGIPAAEHGVHLGVLDDDGEPVPEGHLGEIAVTGPNVTDGYHAGREGGSSRFVGGQLRTGDAGFVHEGDLFVLGRMGDALKVNGRSVYVEDLDVKVAAATGLNKSRLAVVAVHGAGAAASVGGVALFAEANPRGDWTGPARIALRGQLGEDFPITLIAGTRGLIKRTSSGKPRRSHMWRLFQEGDLGQAVLVEEPAAAEPEA